MEVQQVVPATQVVASGETPGPGNPFQATGPLVRLNVPPGGVAATAIPLAAKAPITQIRLARLVSGSGMTINKREAGYTHIPVFFKAKCKMDYGHARRGPPRRIREALHPKAPTISVN